MAMNHAYDMMGGVKLKVVAPSTLADKFAYTWVRGALEAHLANFGKYVLGTTIQAEAYLALHETGCESMKNEAN